MFQYISSANTLRFNQEKCVGCGMCLKVCPHAVFVEQGKKVSLSNPKKCMECGACAKNCAFSAIEVDAGVGCATALFNRLLGKKGDCCCSEDCC